MKSESERTDPLQREERDEPHGEASSHRTVRLDLDSTVPTTSESRQRGPGVEVVMGKGPPTWGAARATHVRSASPRSHV